MCVPLHEHEHEHGVNLKGEEEREQAVFTYSVIVPSFRFNRIIYCLFVLKVKVLRFPPLVAR